MEATLDFHDLKEKESKDSFRLNGTIKLVGRKLQLPRIGKIRIKERRKRYWGGRILSVTVRRRADRWFASITVEEEIPEPTTISGVSVGVDLGVKTLATLSDGTTIDNPHALGRHIKKLKKLSRTLSRKKRGSKNREKAKRKLAMLYLKTFNIRQDILHKLTTYLAKNHSKIVIEDLAVSGMMKNRSLARAIADVGMYAFRRQLEYKCLWYGSQLLIAPRRYPSSKKCSRCGHKKNDLSLSERLYHCTECGFKVNRDLNAALNLVAVSLPETQNACGEDRRLTTNPTGFAKQASGKQEPDINQESQGS